jgi:hypothetical protein
VKAGLGKVKDENPALSNKEAFKVVAAKWSADFLVSLSTLNSQLVLLPVRFDV